MHGCAQAHACALRGEQAHTSKHTHAQTPQANTHTYQAHTRVYVRAQGTSEAAVSDAVESEWAREVLESGTSSAATMRQIITAAPPSPVFAHYYSSYLRRCGAAQDCTACRAVGLWANLEWHALDQMSIERWLRDAGARERASERACLGGGLCARRVWQLCPGRWCCPLQRTRVHELGGRGCKQHLALGASSSMRA